MNIALRVRRLVPAVGLTLTMAALGALITTTSSAAGIGALIAGQSGSGQIELNPAHPERYVVQRGDTLWDISGMFLKDPWFWPEIWYVNPQVENPHLIYPGDVLTLVYIDGQPRIQLDRGGAGNTERLSPQIREQSLDDAIATIPFEVISAFLSKVAVLEASEIDGLPYIVAMREGHLIGSAGNDLYVRGDIGDVNEGYSVVHIGEPLVDPDNGDVVGYEGVFVGDGEIRRGGDPATLKLTRTRREALEGDRLVKQDFSIPLQFVPRPPESEIDGQIIHVVDGVTNIGQYQVVVLNRGARDGLDVGHVLSVWQLGDEVRDRFAIGAMNEKVRLPDERAGTLMIFKTYDRISYALIMEATSEIHVLDRATNPG